MATVFHVLFNIENPENVALQISEESLVAADNFVSVCLQHAAYIAGRGLLQDAIQQAEERKWVCSEGSAD